jgi:hypothetical protein
MPATPLESAIAASLPELIVDEEVSELARRTSGRARLDLRERRGGPLGEAVEDRLCQRLLGREELIERADRRARAARDLGHGGRLIALLGEKLGAGIDKRSDPLLAPLPFRLLGQSRNFD